jgi:hypothetical protein
MPVTEVPQAARDLQVELPAVTTPLRGVFLQCSLATVRVREGGALQVAAQCRARGESADIALSRCRDGKLLATLDANGILQLRTIYPSDCPLARVDYLIELTVPIGVPVSVRSLGGHLALRGLSGDLDVRSETADIDAWLAGGRAVLMTETGRMQVQGRAESLELRTLSGSVLTQLESGGSLPRLLQFESKSGSLTVELPLDASLEVDLEAMPGKLFCNLPIRADGEEREGGALQHTVGRIGRDPRSRLVARTETGRIALRSSGEASFTVPMR